MTPPPIAKSLQRAALGTILLLLVPFVAMQFTAEVNWGPGDFLAAGGLLFAAGTVYRLASPRITGARGRVALASAVLLGLIVVWVELAVGLFQ